MPRAKKETCDLCCDPIQKEQDSLKCEGDCGCIVHRYCAGVTRTYYDALRKSSSPFVCQFCSLKANNAVIQQLQMTIESLKTELAAVKNLSMSQRNGGFRAAHSGLGRRGSVLLGHRKNVCVMNQPVSLELSLSPYMYFTEFNVHRHAL